MSDSKGNIMKFISLVAGLMVASTVYAGPAIAHGGGLDKYGGHTEKFTGVYHCHGKTDTWKRQACDLRTELKEAEAANSKLQADKVKAATLVSDFAELQFKLKGEQNKVRSVKYELNSTIKKLRAQVVKTGQAKRDMREAKTRAAGTGPEVSSKCSSRSSTMVGHAKEALREACLY